MPSLAKRRIAVLLTVLSLGAASPTRASIFIGPSSGLSTSFNFGADFYAWDFSNMVVSDTADGLRISGSMSAVRTDVVSDPDASIVWLVFGAFRPFSLPGVTPLLLTSQLDARVATTGGARVTIVQANTLVNFNIGGLCAASATVEGHSLQGAISDGPNTNDGGTCLADPAPQPMHVRGDIFIRDIPNGASTITFDFGSSILGSGSPAVAIPEPTTMLLIAGAIPLLLGLKYRGGPKRKSF